MTTSLMATRRFAPLFWTQFLSAFNDNFLKNVLVFLILFQVGTTGQDATTASSLIALAGAIFISPFLFLSALGGELADKYDKSKLARRYKLVEVGGAGLAIVGMAISSIPVLFVTLFLFGAMSALFSPVKYSLLPEHLETSDLPKANAWVEAGTFLAILGGTISAGFLYATGQAALTFAPVMIALAGGCYAFSRFIPKTTPASPNLKVRWNIAASTWHILKDLGSDNRLVRIAMMNAWFWLSGALVMSLLPVMVKDILGGGEVAVTYFLTVFAVSIGIGSALAAWFSAGRVVLLPAPVGTLLIALFCLDTAFVLSGASPISATSGVLDLARNPDVLRLTVDMAGLAISGAMLVVPTFTALQTWSKPENRARVIAGSNALGAGIMTVGGIGLAIAQSYGVTVSSVMIVLAGLNLIAAIVMFKTLRTNPMRDFISILYRAFFRMEVKGLENLEKAGEAPILAMNHVSYLDAGLALTLTDKAPTFAIDYDVAQRWWVRPFLRLANALPINPAKPMATRSLINVVKSGEPMAIFPEGRLTVTGGLMKVYDGAAMVADKTGAQIVPIRIDGLEKTPFSYLSPSQISKKLFPKVKVTIMEPRKLELPEELKGRKRRAAAGSALYSLMSDLMFQTSLSEDKTILDKVIEAGREHGMSSEALEDPVTGKLTYSKILTGASVLARKITKLAPGEDTVGVMLPNANGSVVTVLGTMSAGKVPAMINFTAGPENILAACTAAGVKTIFSSQAFIKQAKLEPLVEAVEEKVRFIWLDEVRKTIGTIDKMVGLLTKTRPLVQSSADDRAVILFTSGSEGTPKGVVLTHKNILANATQAAARIDFTPSDKVFNVLPMFHSFGLTTGTILPLISGVKTFLYPSPLHYRIIPELIYASNATILFGTDTFLNGYARVAHAYDFRSLRYCFAGAEPVKPSTRETYMERFGVRILEGYGVTETAPVIAINTPIFNKPGSVGKLMPGMKAQLEPVPGVETGGRLLVSGPNVMIGYLKTDKPGVLQPLVDGWHDTGDIVEIDEDGFIIIKGRAKRFAKIGGEMVSLAAVESLAGQIWPEYLSAVAAVKDPRKGEKLIMITDNPDADRSSFVKEAKQRGAQDLMIPSDVRVVTKVPVLGSGKLDFGAINKMVAEGETDCKAA
ncbi:acylglycerophosphoethanolamine acyltransferase [Roseibium sp. TrichSKD4]|uniref:acyl-[ACP]--phospholipid O-acyltransferase n=1 Tax=Roseibium sp. TrichSKD4 TaxID=744980 RepID=UPI0001E564A0|nr:acyl-[ACP]--phospholipid O-acyltransferase [Roseibium sp. TrichSKD4]EFO34166.1 acylglycerophosphoethanolamine acyltransferase [Roseibium sp. TrichSKD4]